MGQDQSSPSDASSGTQTNGDTSSEPSKAPPAAAPAAKQQGPSYQAPLAAPQQTQKALSKAADASSSGETTFHRLTEAELDKLVYAQKNDAIDIYDTSINRELKALLMSINDNSTSTGFRSAASATALGGGRGQRKELSANAAEFIPGQFYGSSSMSSSAATAARAVATQQEMRAQAERDYEEWTKKNAAKQEEIAKKLSLQQRVEAITKASNAIPAGHKLWRYKDPRGVERGPFTFGEMRNWYEKGYFTHDLEITIREGGPFIRLGELYGPGHQPFSTKLSEAQVIVTCAALISSRARRSAQGPATSSAPRSVVAEEEVCVDSVYYLMASSSLSRIIIAIAVVVVVCL
ncbi:hypothetical protein FOZ63_013758 [Perkinsus olseni]|uniref:GYF domain-containing protein n=1 Tax=Perkinsus olseni TaxID=32597 RepID=A0A7J6T0X2_PEROL|nr:hypothetical protein FOZ63_013758 [Perkinsus olseni]